MNYKNIFIFFIGILFANWFFNIYHNIKYAKKAEIVTLKILATKDCLLDVSRESPKANLYSISKKDNKWVSEKEYINKIFIKGNKDDLKFIENIDITVGFKEFKYSKEEIDNLFNKKMNLNNFILEVPNKIKYSKSLFKVFDNILNWPGDLIIISSSFPLFSIYIISLIFIGFIFYRKYYVESFKNLLSIFYNKSTLLSLIILTILFIFQFLLFRKYFFTEILESYPVFHDQSGYLSLTYSWYKELLDSNSLIYFFNEKFLQNNYATGVLLYFQSLFTYMLFGASRFTALINNFLYFIFLQLIVFISIKKITNKYKFAFFGVLLILLLNYPFSIAGGLFDFRIDFITFCLYGILISLVLKSNVFQYSKDVFFISLIGIILIMFRFFTIIYIDCILIASFLFFLSYKFFMKNIDELNTLRLKNIFNIGLIINLFSLPLIVLNKTAIYNYYFIGHLFGIEKNIRAEKAGVVDFMSNILFYPKSIFLSHLNLFLLFLLIIFIILTILVLIVEYLKKAKINYNISNVFFIVITILIPIIILTLNHSKSPVVGAIVLIPIIWLLFFLYKFIFYKIINDKYKIFILFILFFIVFYFQLSSYNKKYFTINNIENVLEISKDVGEYSISKIIDEPHISFDRIADYFTTGTFSVINFEKNKKLINFKVELGDTIFSINYNEVLAKINNSHFVVISDSIVKSGYPFDTDINKMKPDLNNYIKKEFKFLKSYNFDNTNFELYGSKKYF